MKFKYYHQKGNGETVKTPTSYSSLGHSFLESVTGRDYSNKTLFERFTEMSVKRWKLPGVLEVNGVTIDSKKFLFVLQCHLDNYKQIIWLPAIRAREVQLVDFDRYYKLRNQDTEFMCVHFPDFQARYRSVYNEIQTLKQGVIAFYEYHDFGDYNEQKLIIEDILALTPEQFV